MHSTKPLALHCTGGEPEKETPQDRAKPTVKNDDVLDEAVTNTMIYTANTVQEAVRSALCCGTSENSDFVDSMRSALEDSAFIGEDDCLRTRVDMRDYGDLNLSAKSRKHVSELLGVLSRLKGGILSDPFVSIGEVLEFSCTDMSEECYTSVLKLTRELMKSVSSRDPKKVKITELRPSEDQRGLDVRFYNTSSRGSQESKIVSGVRAAVCGALLRSALGSKYAEELSVLLMSLAHSSDDVEKSFLMQNIIISVCGGVGSEKKGSCLPSDLVLGLMDTPDIVLGPRSSSLQWRLMKRWHATMLGNVTRHKSSCLMDSNPEQFKIDLSFDMTNCAEHQDLVDKAFEICGTVKEALGNRKMINFEENLSCPLCVWGDAYCEVTSPMVYRNRGRILAERKELYRLSVDERDERGASAQASTEDADWCDLNCAMLLKKMLVNRRYEMERAVYSGVGRIVVEGRALFREMQQLMSGEWLWKNGSTFSPWICREIEWSGIIKENQSNRYWNYINSCIREFFGSTNFLQVSQDESMEVSQWLLSGICAVADPASRMEEVMLKSYTGMSLGCLILVPVARRERGTRFFEEYIEHRKEIEWSRGNIKNELLIMRQVLNVKGKCRMFVKRLSRNEILINIKHALRNRCLSGIISRITHEELPFDHWHFEKVDVDIGNITLHTMQTNMLAPEEYVLVTGKFRSK